MIPDNPYGAYDRSKARQRWMFSRQARRELDAVIACPTGVIGPYDFRGSMMGMLSAPPPEQTAPPFTWTALTISWTCAMWRMG